MPSINDFSSSFRGGVRPNLFQVHMFPQAAGGNMGNFSWLCKGSSMPVSQVGNIDVPYQGRQLKVPGDRTFADWTVTVFNDPEMSVRSKFEGWMRNIQAHDNNYQRVNSDEVYGVAIVQQLDRKGNTLRSYTMKDIYPTEVAAIDLSWDSNDQVEEYAVTFAVNSWESSHGDSSGSSSGSSVWGGVQIKDGEVDVNLGGMMKTALGNISGAFNS